MKKILALCVLLSLVLMLCGCGASGAANTTSQNDATEEILEDVNEIIDEINEILDRINTNIAVDAAPPSVEPNASEKVVTNFDLWLEAESVHTERYMYETLIEGFLIADDEIEHGWIDAGTKAFLKVIKGDTLSLNATTTEYMNAYRSLDSKLGTSDYCIRDFFTVDEFDNSTNGGIYNFLEAIDQLEDDFFGGRDLVSISSNGNFSWDFDDEEVADALGISEELIDILMHAAVDAGFSITFN